MDTPKVFESEYRFCLILWENEPVKSSKLVELCKEQLGWKPTTTYTVIKRLSERGVLKNENTVVTSLISKDEVQAAELNEMVEKTFEGSLPAFYCGIYKAPKDFRQRNRCCSADDRPLQERRKYRWLIYS